MVPGIQYGISEGQERMIVAKETLPALVGEMLREPMGSSASSVL
jgi:hypothetical protein